MTNDEIKEEITKQVSKVNNERKLKILLCIVNNIVREQDV